MNIQWLSALQARLDDWRAQGLTRTMHPFSSAQLPTSTIAGHDRVLFSSSNYLGLAEHPALRSAAANALYTYGTGTGGSRLTTGTTELHLRTEQLLASWLGYPECAFFATGYQANLGVLSTLADQHTIIFSDERNHASIIDGCRLAAASKKSRTVVYPHRDVATLRRLIDTHRPRRALIVTDGVFSMDGTIAPIPELIALAREVGALTVVDDAHGVGAIGPGGRGCTEGGALPDVLIGTASKALGAEGGFACASPVIAELLRNQARSFVFSTSPPAPTLAAVSAAVDLLHSDATPLPSLQANSRTARVALREAGFRVDVPAEVAATSPIIPIPIGPEEDAMRIAEELQVRGFHVPAIRYPTVPRGQAILRVTIMATHTPSQIRRFVDILAEVAGAAKVAEVAGGTEAAEVAKETTNESAGDPGGEGLR